MLFSPDTKKQSEQLLKFKCHTQVHMAENQAPVLVAEDLKIENPAFSKQAGLTLTLIY